MSGGPFCGVLRLPYENADFDQVVVDREYHRVGALPDPRAR